ncbi:hypothetical protein EN856_37580 [Mesorhizobium sp. M8A.F.Ca.ET.213.01.1.1]|nr:hypothetical protein EN856_37580 [Mesorhizobium sp. M8A.F.Ca.ET.213.01.1.1]
MTVFAKKFLIDRRQFASGISLEKRLSAEEEAAGIIGEQKSSIATLSKLKWPDRHFAVTASIRACRSGSVSA